MAEGVITVKAREDLTKAHAGDITLPAIKYMAFGNGGLDTQGNPVNTTGEEVSLRNELLRKNIDTHSYPIKTTCRYSVRLEKQELANQVISEQGLFDENGSLVAYKTFLPKGKDEDMEFIFDMDEVF